MKRIWIAGLAALALLPAGAGAQSSSGAGEGSLTIDFQNIKVRRGVVLGALFDSRGTYDANKGSLRELKLPAADGDISVTIAGLKPGWYAVKTFQDIDANGAMRFNPVGMPLEPYAFSNNARGLFGPASWRSAAFEVRPGPNHQVLRLK
ncbi:uncharacterized protein (DUF2141 family) [Caulobacter ginsengisoli]|uniref:Uncharacterized protein (DUF2141 family) n=1 Tax=Caulobacter ginsengisoli TaxID=400775 RepID=A0ABU0IYD8_9CAUL|nr:DUF2141 domain-containing protein [Caulobacter ginsengisoli]MDQ0466198.1 uncharacterized protein (DUF2141 family) [Caulobacter ginsengisoli]